MSGPTPADQALDDLVTALRSLDLPTLMDRRRREVAILRIAQAIQGMIRAG